MRKREWIACVTGNRSIPRVVIDDVMACGDLRGSMIETTAIAPPAGPIGRCRLLPTGRTSASATLNLTRGTQRTGRPLQNSGRDFARSCGGRQLR